MLKPAEQTPALILVLMDLLVDILPPGMVNIINGLGPEAGRALAESPRIAKLAFTGATTTGRLIAQYAAQNLTPLTLELVAKAPTCFSTTSWQRMMPILLRLWKGLPYLP